MIPTVALADFGSWVSGLGTQDYVALGVLAFLVIFVIPSLVGDILENQADPAAAIAKKQQKLKDLEDKYSFLVGDAPAPAPAADEPPADEFTQRKAEADAAASDEADALLASVKAMTNKDNEVRKTPRSSSAKIRGGPQPNAPRRARIIIR